MSYPVTAHGPMPSSEWTRENPLLDQFEIGMETDTGKAKMGDGIHKWNDLDYWNPGGVTGGISTGETWQGWR